MADGELHLTSAEADLLNRAKVQTDEDIMFLPSVFCDRTNFDREKRKALQFIAEDKHCPVLTTMWTEAGGYSDEGTAILNPPAVDPSLASDLLIVRPGIFPFGAARLDSMFRGGVHTGNITELVGPSASGKTQLCHQLATTSVLQEGVKVVYIDSSHSFDPQRILQIAGIGQGEEAAAKLLERIEVFKAFDTSTLMTILTQVVERLENSFDTLTPPVRVVIIDSLGALLAPIVGGRTSAGHAMLSAVSRMMKVIASDHHVAFVVTNHTVSSAKGTRQTKPALGLSWTYVADTRVALSHANPHAFGKIYAAKLMKSCRSEVGALQNYTISDSGVRDSHGKQLWGTADASSTTPKGVGRDRKSVV